MKYRVTRNPLLHAIPIWMNPLEIGMLEDLATLVIAAYTMVEQVGIHTSIPTLITSPAPLGVGFVGTARHCQV
jgi:hypothetical protein